MTAFNVELTIVNVEAVPLPTEDPSEQPKAIQVQGTVGLGLPVGPNQMGIIPLGTVNFLLDRESVDKITEAGSALAAKPNLPADFTIASNLSEVERAAEAMRKASGI